MPIDSVPTADIRLFFTGYGNGPSNPSGTNTDLYEPMARREQADDTIVVDSSHRDVKEFVKESDFEEDATRTIGRRALVGVMGLALATVACGGANTAKSSHTASTKKRFDAIDLFPADLDVVLRVDLARMRASLGPMTDGLSERVQSEMDARDELASRAIERARVAWIGTRIADIEAGDRVMVIEGDVEDLRPDPSLFQLLDPPLSDAITTFDRRGPLSRDATARIHLLGGRTMVFVSGVEVDGVERVLLRGADPGRRDPPADGLLSADVRGRRLPAEMERRFPSIGAIVRGVKRARASVTMVDDGLRADVEVATASGAAGSKLESFLKALREGGQGSRYAALFDGMRVERLEQAVRVTWLVPVETLRPLL
jgi:hypothetical protein